MAAVTEDTSFLIFASVRRGSTIAPFLSSAVATVHGPAGKTELVSLRDNGLCKLYLPFNTFSATFFLELS